MALPRSLDALDGMLLFSSLSMMIPVESLGTSLLTSTAKETTRILQPGGIIAFTTWIERKS